MDLISKDRVIVERLPDPYAAISHRYGKPQAALKVEELNQPQSSNWQFRVLNHVEGEFSEVLTDYRR